MSQPSEPQLWPPQVTGFDPASLPRSIASLRSAEVDWSAPGLPVVAAATGRRPSAVMMLFLPAATPGAPARLLFTRRSTEVRSHKGQVSFAGGRSEASDPSPAATARRELAEEVGLAEERVAIAGMLAPLRGLDGSGVVPVVGLALAQPNELLPAAAEVAAIFAAPWPHFCRGEERPFRFNLFGHWRESLVFSTPLGNVWGLTAMVLHAAALA